MKKPRVIKGFTKPRLVQPPAPKKSYLKVKPDACSNCVSFTLRSDINGVGDCLTYGGVTVRVDDHCPAHKRISVEAMVFDVLERNVESSRQRATDGLLTGRNTDFMSVGPDFHEPDDRGPLTPYGLLNEQIAIQLDFIVSRGTNLQGYIRRYGDANDPHRHGDGGQAIYDADMAELTRLLNLRDKA